jgi:hypothetical protein
MGEVRDNFGNLGYTIPVAYGFGGVEEMIEAFDAEKRPLNAKTIALEWTRSKDVGDAEMARIMGTAVILHANTAEGVTIWDCLYVAWIFERG